MLPLGRKNAKRCTECGITCHANCAHLVPDFCGMSMETANQLLAEIQKVKASRSAVGKTQPQRPMKQHTLSESTPPSPQYPLDQRQPVEALRTSLDNMRMGPPDQSPVQDYGQTRPLPSQLSGVPERYPPQDSQQQYGQQIGGPPYSYSPEGAAPVQRPPPGARVPAPIPYADPVGRPSSGYDRFPPPTQGAVPAPDGYPPGYTVSVIFASHSK